MTRHKGGPTVNQGGASKPTAEEAAAEFQIAGKGGKPSPGDRARGETSAADATAAVDVETHDRAS
jgi:hypothetical protein